jgi:hypothetical protein
MADNELKIDCIKCGEFSRYCFHLTVNYDVTFILGAALGAEAGAEAQSETVAFSTSILLINLAN